jgi:hypothetical protein
MATSTTSSFRTGAVPPVPEHGERPVFAAVVLGVAGVMRIFDAIWAFRYHGALPNDLENAIFGHSLDTYGWVYLAVGIVLIASAVFAMRGSALARWIGMAAGGIAAITAAWWLPYYPVWSLVYIALGATVIYSLAAHRETHHATGAGSW